ncbi:MAG TPA: hypothetical protein VG754_11605 [Verrucomicrobiae bacterium]|nr:hypothetical protein [Verrucomicrobiae bacterium]
MALICAATVTSWNVQAQKAVTDEQKALKKEMLEKYDTNKDGKLDKDERAKMTPEDKAKWSKAFPHKKKKTDDGSSSSTTPAPETK